MSDAHAPLVVTLPRMTHWMKALSLYTGIAWLALKVLPYVSPRAVAAIVWPLVLIPDRVIPGMQLWRCVTYPLVQDAAGWSFAFQILAFWWIGSPLEQRQGGMRMLQLGIAGALGGALFALVGARFSLAFASEPVRGMASVSGAFFAALLVALRGEQLAFFPGMRPMRALYVGLAWVGIAVVQMIFEPSAAGLANLGGMAGGAACMALLSMGSGDPDDDGRVRGKRKRSVSGGRLRLVRTENDKHRWN